MIESIGTKVSVHARTRRHQLVVAYLLLAHLAIVIGYNACYRTDSPPGQAWLRLLWLGALEVQPMLLAFAAVFAPLPLFQRAVVAVLLLAVLAALNGLPYGLLEIAEFHIASVWVNFAAGVAVWLLVRALTPLRLAAPTHRGMNRLAVRLTLAKLLAMFAMLAFALAILGYALRGKGQSISRYAWGVSLWNTTLPSLMAIASSFVIAALSAVGHGWRWPMVAILAALSAPLLVAWLSHTPVHLQKPFLVNLELVLQQEAGMLLATLATWLRSAGADTG